MGLCYARDRLRARSGWLLILVTLLWQGLSGLSLAVFTQMTPPPGEQGGLLNAIVGSLIMTSLGVVIGTPLGILAGTYMAEYGRYTRAHHDRPLHQRHPAERALDRHRPVRLQIMVAPMGHFSAMAGVVALAVIVIPVVVRTTENMLLLVPGSLREAAARSACRALVGHQQDRLQGRARRAHHRRSAGDCARQRRDRAAAVHRAQQSVLAWTSMRRWRACRSSSSSSR